TSSSRSWISSACRRRRSSRSRCRRTSPAAARLRRTERCYSPGPPMPRDLPIGNERLLVLFDDDYVLRDLYYPNVGKENHAGGYPFRFGVFVGGRFSWVRRDTGWKIERRYE